MTTPDSPHDRVRSHFQAVTNHLDLEAAPVSHLKNRAARRTARRRQFAALGVVAAASVAVVGGVAVLSQSEPSSVITSSDTDGEPGAESAPAVDVPGTEPGAAPPGTEASQAAPAVTVPSGAELADPFGELGTPTEVDPAFVWKVVDPGKEVSISGTFSGTLQGSFPTFALSTAPGRSNDYDNIETVLYRSDDGIRWTRTEAQSPFAGGYWNAQVNDDQIFVTGTMPGIAKTDPNPLRIAVGAGEAWEFAELPVDTNAKISLPMVNVNGPQVSSVPYGDGVLVVITEQAYPDYEALMSELGVDRNDAGFLEPTPDGMVMVDGACLNEGNGSYDPARELFGPIDGSGGEFIDLGIANLQDGDDFRGCPVEVRSWAELGMPSESIEAMSNPMSRFFTVSSGLDVEEIDPPDVGGFTAVRGSRPIVELSVPCCSEVAPPRFELVAGSWVESMSTVPTMLSRQGIGLEELGDLRVGLFGTTNDGRVPFMSVDADGSYRGVDLQDLLRTEAVVASSWTEHAATTDSLWVGAVQTYDDPIAEEGGVELAFGDVIVRQESERSRFELLDASTREPIDRALVSGDDRGMIEVRRSNGEVRATFHADEVYEAMSSTYGQQRPPTMSLVTTADGTSFSVESVATLLGVTDADISRIARVASDGTTVIVTVTLRDRYPDDIAKQLVLVGTPIG